MNPFRSIRSAYSFIVAGLVAALLGSAAVAAEPAGITTGVKGAVYYQVAQDIKKACDSVVPLTIYESVGSISNVERVLSDKQYQYGITQHDALAYKALSDPKAKEKIKMLVPLYNNDIHLVATAASGIRSINDLRGKRVVIGADGSGNWVTSQIIKSKTGITWIDQEVSAEQGVTNLLLGQADAMIYVMGKPAPLLTKLGAAATGKLKLVPLSHPALEGFYQSTTFPDGLYPLTSSPSINKRSAI